MKKVGRRESVDVGVEKKGDDFLSRTVDQRVPGKIETVSVVKPLGPQALHVERMCVGPLFAVF